MKNHLSIIIVFGVLFSLAAQADESTSTLWDSAREQGGWRAFGGGMLAAKVVNGSGLEMAVDWTETTFGVGAVFEKGEYSLLPSLEGKQRLVVDARSSDENGTTLAPEWVDGEKTWRVAADGQALTSDWATYTFEIPADFPKLAGSEAQVKALRLLFINPQKPGRATVYFSNVRLEP